MWFERIQVFNKHTWSHLKVLKNNLSVLENIWCDCSIKHSQKRDKTNATKIWATDKAYMHTKTNRNMHRHKHR